MTALTYGTLMTCWLFYENLVFEGIVVIFGFASLFSLFNSMFFHDNS